MLYPLLLVLGLASSTVPRDTLVEAFTNPPSSAKPHTWWHWMNGNVTKEGITADLEAMKQVGIGGAQMFTVDQGIPAGKVPYNSEVWREMTAWAVKEASRLGVELCIHNCAGWSSSGGPWITPENSMQVLAWSETFVKGGQTGITLPVGTAPMIRAKVDYYKDIAVFAYPSNSHRPAKNDRVLMGQTGVTRQESVSLDLTLGDVNAIVPASQILDLTSKMDSAGNLNWTPPAGDWTIIRLGHVSTGKDNHPGPPEGTGLEVDKLSRSAMDQHWAGLMQKVLDEIGPAGGKALNNALIDSYEVGSQNWTPKMRQEFLRLRGYDPMPYMPALTGITIESRATTDRFLWDYRRTIADLFTANYYTYFGELCHKAGLKFSTEPYGDGNFDNIQAGGTADIPMGEFWAGGYETVQTTKLAASVGHVYGKPVIGAESFTATESEGAWLEEPFASKALGDFIFCNGVNRYIFHRYAMQPWLDKVPGMTMGPWGSHFDRTNTWWTEAQAWMKYIARCQYLLQRGLYAADVLYFYGEDAPADMPYPKPIRGLPDGYAWDACDVNVLLNRVNVKNGMLVLPDGMRYRALALPERKTMSLRLAQKVKALVDAGATVVGPAPIDTPSLADVKLGAQRVPIIGQYLSSRLQPAGSWLKILKNVPPDVSYRSTSGGSKLAWIHRTSPGQELYFVSNQEYRDTRVDVDFRVTGKAAELFHADTGKTELAPVVRYGQKLTTVGLTLGPAESVFVVFRKPVTKGALTSIRYDDPALKAFKDPQVQVLRAFYGTADGRGADVTAKVKALVAAGDRGIAATNANFGDPVLDVVKQLTIEYTLDGKPMKQVVAENRMLMLKELPPVRPSTADLTLQNGKVSAAFWQGGTYHLQRGTKSSKFVAANPTSLEITGPWKLTFAPNLGAPPSATFETLQSWSDSSDPGIKYFSGSAHYVKDVTVAPDTVAGNRSIRLQLGTVKNFATVQVNGRQVAVLWKAPFTVDVTGYLKPGVNHLDIKVTNLWPNRIIGDEQLPPDVEWEGTHLKKWPDWLLNNQPRPKTGRITFETWRYWYKDSKLLPSGLLGPVVLQSAKVVRLP